VAALLGTISCTAAAQAVDPAKPSFPQVWLNPGVYAEHFDSDKGLRNDNIGVGGEAWLAEDHGLLAGSYINSNRARSHYAGYEWRPLHWDIAGLKVGAGVMLSGFNGYPNYRGGAWFVAPLPVLSIEGKTLGANISLIPTVANRFDGALLLQIKLRVW
jgi:hypothetical protein